MISLVEPFIPYLMAAIAFVAVLFGYGKKREAEGREKEREELEKEIEDAGKKTVDRIDKALADSDLNADTAAEWLQSRYKRK